VTRTCYGGMAAIAGHRAPTAMGCSITGRIPDGYTTDKSAAATVVNLEADYALACLLAREMRARGAQAGGLTQ